MNNEATVKAFSTLLGSKSVAECAVAYLSRCREIPLVDDVMSALRVPFRTAEKIVAAAGLSFQFLLDTMPIKVGNPGLVAAYLSDLKNATVEHLVALTVSADNTLICRHECATGSGARVSIDPSTLFKFALEDNARGIIVAHNHPSGSPKFSQGDYDFTRHLIEAGKVLGISLLDSVVISNRGVASMRNERPEMFNGGMF